MKIFTLRNLMSAAMCCGCGLLSVAQPTASAPVPPEYAASKVLSVYSDAFTPATGWNFGDWGSGTQYAEETIAGTEDKVARFITTDLGYFGWEFHTDVNAVTMTNIHLDIWSDSAFEFDLTPICRVQTSEVAQRVSVAAGEWTSVDLDLAYYTEQGLDLSGVFQLKYSNTGARTFYVDNVYFYNTSTDVDTEAPTALTAELVSASYFSVTLSCNATDNSGAVNFKVTDEANGISVERGGVSGTDVELEITGLSAATDYNFTVSVADADGNTCESTVAVTATTLATPEAAPVPTVAAENVISIFSDVYEPATTYIIGSWGQTTSATEVELGEGDHAYFLDNFNYLGMELNGNVAAFDATGMTHLHIDLYSSNITRFQITPIWGSEALYDCTVEPNTWNSLDVSLSEAYPGLNYANIYQLKMQAEPSSTTEAFIDNIYFYDATGAGVESIAGENVRVYAVDGSLCVDADSAVSVDVYNLAGVAVYSNAAVQSVRVALAEGVYVVRAGDKVQKVIVR